VAKFFTVPHTGEVAFLGPLGGGDMNCLYRDVRMPRRRALGLALFQPVKHVVVTLRCGCAPSAAAGFKNYSAFTFMPKCFGIKCGLGVSGLETIQCVPFPVLFCPKTVPTRWRLTSNFLFDTWLHFNGSTSNDNLMFDDFGFCPRSCPRLSPSSSKMALSCPRYRLLPAPAGMQQTVPPVN
jgi:hypothetical protein